MIWSLRHECGKEIYLKARIFTGNSSEKDKKRGLTLEFSYHLIWTRGQSNNNQYSSLSLFVNKTKCLLLIICIQSLKDYGTWPLNWCLSALEYMIPAVDWSHHGWWQPNATPDMSRLSAKTHTYTCTLRKVIKSFSPLWSKLLFSRKS